MFVFYSQNKTKQNTTEYRQISPKSYNKHAKIAKSIAVTDALNVLTLHVIKIFFNPSVISLP